MIISVFDELDAAISEVRDDGSKPKCILVSKEFLRYLGFAMKSLGYHGLFKSAEGLKYAGIPLIVDNMVCRFAVVKEPRYRTVPNEIVQFWLAELSIHGNPKLIDGAHSQRSGAEKALTLHKRLNMISTEGKRYAIAEVRLSEPTGEHEPLNEGAINILNSLR